MINLSPLIIMASRETPIMGRGSRFAHTTTRVPFPRMQNAAGHEADAARRNTPRPPTLPRSRRICSAA